MKKQTAVGWLQEQYYESEGKLTRKDFEQAKVMEREQIVEAYLEGVQTIHHEDYLPIIPPTKEDKQ
jgi:hypothetical protein